MKESKNFKIGPFKASLLIPIFILLFSAICLITSGYSSYAGSIEGDLNGDCNVCHPPGDLAGLNPYGIDFEAETNHAADAAGAVAAIGGIDSDGDGYLNRHELENASNPGDVNDIPTGIPKVPHLDIIDVYTSPENAEAGHRVLIYVRIANNGDANAEGVVVQLIENGENAAEPLTGVSIEKASNQTVIFRMEPEEGIHNYNIEITYSDGSASKIAYLSVSPEHDTELLPFPGTITILLLIFTLTGLVRYGLKRTGGNRHE
ncbi:MAG: hypothetical protein KAS67_02620 [Thermoplasmata archaeon]|nr:hypothetical protein [Thermoplasmata archaeon]